MVDSLLCLLSDLLLPHLHCLDGVGLCSDIASNGVNDKACMEEEEEGEMG